MGSGYCLPLHGPGARHNARGQPLDEELAAYETDKLAASYTTEPRSHYIIRSPKVWSSPGFFDRLPRLGSRQTLPRLTLCTFGLHQAARCAVSSSAHSG